MKALDWKPWLFLLAISLPDCLLIAQNIEQHQLRIASWNVRNYLEVNRWVDGHYMQNYPKPEKEKRALRAILLKFHPDILLIQEMGNELYLKELQLDLKNEGLEYPFAYVAEASDEHRHLACLSRFEPCDIQVHRNLDFNYQDARFPVKRGLLELHFKWQGDVFKIYTVHLKSRWTDFENDPGSQSRRRKEALVMRNFIRKAHETDQLPYLILGDFNDTRNAAAFRLMSSVNGEAFAPALRLEDSRGEVWTHYYAKNGEYSGIDYILASRGFPWLSEAWSGSIVDDPAWADASDHRMIWVDLNQD